MGAERSLVREDAEDVAALAVIVALLAILLIALLAVPALAVVDAGDRRRWAFLGVATALRRGATAIPVTLRRRAIRRTRRTRPRRCGARGGQPLVVNPVVGAAERVLAPRRVVFRGESGAFEVVQPTHRQHQPVFALLHHPV